MSSPVRNRSGMSSSSSEGGGALVAEADLACADSQWSPRRATDDRGCPDPGTRLSGLEPRNDGDLPPGLGLEVRRDFVVADLLHEDSKYRADLGRYLHDRPAGSVTGRRASSSSVRCPISWPKRSSRRSGSGLNRLIRSSHCPSGGLIRAHSGLPKKSHANAFRFVGTPAR